MAIIKCKMCGGDLALVEGQSVAECEYCGSRQTVPAADNEKKLTLFARANRLRAACEFDKAAGIYESIVADFPEEAEAYWGLVLCKYGIEYVDDPGTSKKIPTCHRSSFDSVMGDSDFEQALENADAVARKVYRDEAKQIEEIRKGIIEVSGKEEPYDIFICYKETAENGDRTLDSVLAQDIYDALTDKGYRTFFARISLEDKLGQAYEPYIFAALNSAKIMLAVGTDYEYYNAVWVKNEWSRFLKLMEKDKSKHLIPCFKGIDAYDMPKEFAKLQAQDLGKVGAVQDLLRGTEKMLPRQKQKPAIAPNTATTTAAPTVESYLKRVSIFLENGDWESADDYCEKVLDIDPENAFAYLGKLMAELNIDQQAQLLSCSQPFENSINYKQFVRFADTELQNTIVAPLEEKAKQRLEQLNYEEKHAEFYRHVIMNGSELEEYNGYSQTVVHIPDRVTSIGEAAFNCCRSLTSIKIPNSVTSIGAEAFFSCESLTSVTIPDSVTSIGEGVFTFCKNLSSIKIPDSVTSIGANAFYSCESLSSITIPDSVTSIGEGAFAGCSSLTSITIPNSVTSIGAEAFVWCDNLTSITIPDSVTSIGAEAFCGCNQLNILVSPNNKNFRLTDGCLLDIRQKVLVWGSENAKIPHDGSVTAIGKSAFANCKSFTSVTIPDSVTSIGAEAFYSCESLTSVTIPDSVTSIGEHAFANVKMYCPPKSYAAQWGKENKMCVRDIALLITDLEEEMRYDRRKNGLCQHCGGELKGFFGKKCVSCGKPKDY